jgi:hypothetical protein
MLVDMIAALWTLMAVITAPTWPLVVGLIVGLFEDAVRWRQG